MDKHPPFAAGCKTSAILFTATLFFFFLPSCVSLSKQTVSKDVDPEYQPKKVYFLELPEAWKATLRALQDKGIPLANLDQETGIMRTDYQKGPDLLLWKKVLESRYKYNIVFFKESREKTILNIRCLFEVKELEGKRYADATDLAAAEVISREKDLYKTMESYLLPLEGQPKAIQKTPEESEPVRTVALPQPPLPLPEPAPSSPSPPPAQPVLEIQTVPPPAPEKVEPPIESMSVALTRTPKKNHGIILKNASMRAEPSARSKRIAIIKQGREVERLGESGAWVEIKLPWGTTGWILKSLLGKIP